MGVGALGAVALISGLRPVPRALLWMSALWALLGRLGVSSLALEYLRGVCV